MNSEEQRSPELILEYFDLLKWYKSGCRDELSPGELASSEELQLLRQDLNTIRALILEKEQAISHVNGEIDRLKPLLSSAEQNLVALKEKIVLAQQARLRGIEAVPSSRVLEQLRSPRQGTIPPLSVNEALHQLFLEVTHDIKLFFLEIREAIMSNPTALFPFILALSLTLLICINFSFLTNIIFIGTISPYTLVKLKRIYSNHQHKWKQYVEDTEVNRRERVRQQTDIESQLQQNLQGLESRLFELERQYSEHKDYRRQLKSREQELVNQSQAYYSALAHFEDRRNQQSKNYQETLERLSQEKHRRKQSRLLHLEKLAQQWLEKDIDRLTHRAMKRFNLWSREHIGEVGALQSDPILALVGITERTSPSLLVEDGTGFGLEDSHALDIKIKDDFRSEPSYDRKSRKYTVYELLIIFLCPNFLSYYKCYFNFVRAKPINEQYCEYLYDTIVSTKVQEDSSLGLKDDQKNVYSKRLVIATSDGKVICFRIAKSRVVRNFSAKLSQIDEAASEIRRMLRQRRIDYTLTEGLNDT